MMRVAPDWKKMYMSPDILTADLGFDYDGPGFYLWQDCTILITALPRETDRESWDKKQPTHTIFRAYVWNCPYHETIFHLVEARSVPMQLEARGIPRPS